VPTLPPATFASFVLSVLQSLPSSSTSTGLSVNSSDVQAFSEIFVDLAWTVDMELDEFILEAKATLPSSEQAASAQATASQLSKDAITRAEQAKQNAEKDKDTLAAITRSLLVRGYFLPA
jgi:THO complex subunit 2